MTAWKVSERSRRGGWKPLSSWILRGKGQQLRGGRRLFRRLRACSLRLPRFWSPPRLSHEVVDSRSAGFSARRVFFPLAGPVRLYAYICIDSEALYGIGQV